MMGKAILLASTALAAMTFLAAPAAMAADAQAWYDTTSISGRMYYDFTSINADSTTGGVKTKSSKNGLGFDIKRFYVGIDHKFNNMFSGNITTDFQYNSGLGATEIYIKKAYLDAKISDALDIRLGSTDLPWVPFVEGIYGYRYVENTLIDRTKFGTSADWGIHFNGKLDSGLFQYAISVVNGNGYKNPSRSKGVDVEGRLSTQFDGITLAVGGYSGKLGKDKEGVTTYHTATRFDALAAYTAMGARIGVEYFSASDWGNVLTPTKDSADGYSFFASYKFQPEWGVFARYDTVKPNKDTNSSLKDNYYNVGIEWSPTRIVDFSLVYKHDNADHGFINTSNGSIGGGSSGKYDEVGIWGRFRW